MQITDGENLIHLITVFRLMTNIWSFVRSEVSLTKIVEVHYTVWEYSAYSNVPKILMPEAIVNACFPVKQWCRTIYQNSKLSNWPTFFYAVKQKHSTMHFYCFSTSTTIKMSHYLRFKWYFQQIRSCSAKW
jgi:hypothetical protein